MGKHKQVTCQICFKSIRSDNLKRHRKVHEKHIPKQEDTNKEICKELVMSLVDNVLENTSTEKGTITSRSEAQSEERHGSKRTYDNICQNSTELFSINVEKLRKSIDKDEEEYKMKIELLKNVFHGKPLIL